VNFFSELQIKIKKLFYSCTKTGVILQITRNSYYGQSCTDTIAIIKEKLSKTNTIGHSYEII
jgi:hypothetical protein